MPENPLIGGLGKLAGNKAALGSAIALAGRMGLKGLVVLSRGYLGPLAAKAERGAVITPIGANRGSDQPAATTTRSGGLSSGELAILGLAATKLVYELGEIALYNPTLDPAGKQPAFALDENGYAPAMSLAHMAAAMRLVRSSTARSDEPQTQTLMMMKSEPAAAAPAAAPRTRMYAARSAYYGAAPRYGYATAAAPQAMRSTSSAMSSTRTGASMSSSRGCGTCGGSHATPVATPTPTYDPCATGLAAAPRSSEGCGCGGACGCKGGAKSSSGGSFQSSRTYDSEKCPTFAISCETKEALRDCAKTALCSFLECLAETLCPDGRFDSDVFNDPTIGKQLIDCVGQLACSFIHCVPEALCGPTCEALPAPIDCVPCNYAVEVSR